YFIDRQCAVGERREVIIRRRQTALCRRDRVGARVDRSHCRPREGWGTADDGTGFAFDEAGHRRRECCERGAVVSLALVIRRHRQVRLVDGQGAVVERGEVIVGGGQAALCGCDRVGPCVDRSHCCSREAWCAGHDGI